MSGCKDAYLIISIKVKVLKMLSEQKLPFGDLVSLPFLTKLTANSFTKSCCKRIFHDIYDLKVFDDLLPCAIHRCMSRRV